MVEVVTQTTGTEVDPDGYEVRIDTTPPLSIGIDDAVLVEDQVTGPHIVLLSGTSENCCVVPENPRGVTVAADETASTTFMIMCGPVAEGRIAIESNRDGDFEVFVMKADGSSVVNITDNPAIDVETLMVSRWHQDCLPERPRRRRRDLRHERGRVQRDATNQQRFL